MEVNKPDVIAEVSDAFARYVLYQKLAPGYRSIMTNTADSPLLDVFRRFSPTGPSPPDYSTAAKTSTD